MVLPRSIAGDKEVAEREVWIERDYRMVKLSRFEYLTSVLMAAPVTAFIGYVFYGGLAVSISMSLLGLAYPRIRAVRLRERRKSELKEQFKQLLFLVSAALAAGKSFDNALRSAHMDLDTATGASRPYLKEELSGMLARMRNGETAPLVFRRFAERSGIEDVQQFADVLEVVTRSGGNMIEIIRRAAYVMTDKMELEREIEVSIAQKKWEASMLSVMPIVIIALLKISSPDYMEPLYSGVGRGIMTAALLMMAGSLWVVRRMMNIRV